MTNKIKTLAMILIGILLSINQVWGQATAGTVLFSENFGGYNSDGYKTSGSVSSVTNCRVIYGGGNVTYTFTSGTKTSGSTNPGVTQIKKGDSEHYAGGSTPELMIGKKGSGTGATNGSFTIAGIPNGGASEITVSYKQNNNTLYASVTGTGYSTDFTSAKGLQTTSFDIGVANNAAGTFTLTLQASGSNVRVDDISITVKTAGSSGTNYTLVFLNHKNLH